MNFNKFLILITAFILLTFAGCGGTTPTAPNANVQNANSANVNAPVSNTSSTTKTPEAPTINNAPTISPVVQAYYEALKKKDDAGLKKLLSAEFLKSLQEDMKEEKETSLSKFMATNEKIPDNPVEVRNEKIDGNVATVEIKGGSYVGWTAFKFVKEDGQWKYTNEFPDVTAVEKQSANTTAGNTAK